MKKYCPNPDCQFGVDCREGEEIEDIKKGFCVLEETLDGDDFSLRLKCPRCLKEFDSNELFERKIEIKSTYEMLFGDD